MNTVSSVTSIQNVAISHDFASTWEQLSRFPTAVGKQKVSYASTIFQNASKIFPEVAKSGLKRLSGICTKVSQL